MKKILILLALITVLSLLLVSCGTKSGADYLFDSLTNMSERFYETEVMSFFSKQSDTVGFTVTAKDLTDYSSLLSDTDIEDLNISAYFDFEKTKAAQVLKATVNDEKLDASAFENEDDIVVSSSLFDEAYSISTEDFVDELIYNSYGSYALIDSEALLELSKKLPELMTEINDICTRYDKVLREILNENIDFDVEKDGKNVSVSFEVTEKELADIVLDLADKVEDDDKLSKLLDEYDIDVDDIADALRQIGDANIGDFTIEVEMLIQKKNDVLLELSAEIGDGEYAFAGVAYEYDAKSKEFSLEFGPYEDGAIDSENYALLTCEADGKDAYTYDFEFYSSGDKEADISLEIDPKEVYISFDGGYGRQLEASFGYTLKKNSLQIDIFDVSVNGLSIDFEDAGLSILLQKGVKVPAAKGKTVECYDVEDFVEELSEAFYDIDF